MGELEPHRQRSIDYDPKGIPCVSAATSHFMARHNLTNMVKVGLCSPRSILPT